MPQMPLFLFFILHLQTLQSVPILPESEAAVTQTFNTPSTPNVIPAFPEQSDVAGCPLDLPDELFAGIGQACSAMSDGHISRARCCPILAAWMYSAYASTALNMVARLTDSTFDLPLLPDDSETCVNGLKKAMRGRGIELKSPNETCDVVYCYCGIRLHPLRCPEGFKVDKKGKLLPDSEILKLESECKSPTRAGCSRCLRSLHKISSKIVSSREENATRESDHKKRIHGRDCELMGLTWLLAKNRTTYLPTASTVLMSFMMRSNQDSEDPHSCNLVWDGIPLAVNPSSSTSFRFSFTSIFSLFWVFCIFSLYPLLGDQFLFVLYHYA